MGEAKDREKGMEMGRQVKIIANQKLQQALVDRVQVFIETIYRLV